MEIFEVKKDLVMVVCILFQKKLTLCVLSSMYMVCPLPAKKAATGRAVRGLGST